MLEVEPTGQRVAIRLPEVAETTTRPRRFASTRCVTAPLTSLCRGRIVSRRDTLNIH